MYDAEHVHEYFSEKEIAHKLHGNRNEDNEHMTVQEDETNVTLPVQEDVTPVQRAAMLPDAEDEDAPDRKRPGNGRVEIVVPDNVTSVPHYRPSRDVRPSRKSYSDVDEQDNNDILAMRLQQKAERDRKRKKASSGVVEIRKDMKSVRGLSTESVMESIKDAQEQDEEDDRSL